LTVKQRNYQLIEAKGKLIVQLLDCQKHEIDENALTVR